MESIEEFRYLVLAAQREGARALATALKPYGLTVSQAEAIAVLRDASTPLTVREIGQRLVCEGGSPSRLMATLTHKGLVHSVIGAQDRRTTVLSLTESGLDAARTVREIEENLYAALGFVLDADRLDAVIPVLRSLVAQLPAGQALQRRILDREAE
ncbi:winged helix DNA-binding protein [Gordonia sp. TBRC 11910]|uniref:Winged helix DNA-binding protein n=1 Tax=Gordonia asplenii TaxID=2725283 RepID=A0A848KWQ4_9ACTN|nr:winged helix DNA-binding protein [Gordonia asplenii]NMO03254.1 winged helix DNA-binding protein [Gordonia asplenii]